MRGWQQLPPEVLSKILEYVGGDHNGMVSRNLEQLRLANGFTDMTIKVENQSFPCHKVILVSASPYFRSMFGSGLQESHLSQVEIKEIEAAAFEHVMRFIYTGLVDITGENVQGLYTQAHLFQIDHLVEHCVSYLQDNMQEGNCLAAMTLADAYRHEAMYNYAKNFACQHFTTIKDDEDFLILNVEYITDLLRDRNLDCRIEEEVYEAAVQWLEHDPKRKKEDSLRVLQCVKFPLINRSYLTDTVASSDYMSIKACRELLDAAVMYHTVPSRQHLLPSYQITPRRYFPYFECAILLGGRNNRGLSNEVKCYRADTSQFCTLKPLPFKKRGEFAVCAIGDKIYMSGGRRSREFWKYDPTFDQWLRGGNMIQSRRRHAMAAVDDNIYVLGGYDTNKQLLQSVEMWERKANKWENCSTLVTPAETIGSVSLGKMIYLFCGNSKNGTQTCLVQCFDTQTRACIQSSCLLPTNDICLSAAVLNGVIYVAGQKGFFIYQPDDDSWLVLESMLIPRDFVSLCVLNEKLYAFGGRTRRRGCRDNNLYSDNIEVYDPTSGTWSLAGQKPNRMSCFGCVRVLLSGPLKTKVLSGANRRSKKN